MHMCSVLVRFGSSPSVRALSLVRLPLVLSIDGTVFALIAGPLSQGDHRLLSALLPLLLNARGLVQS